MSLARRYLDACQGRLDEAALAALRQDILANTAVAPLLTREGLSMAAEPSPRFRLARCVEAEALPPAVAAQLHRPSPEALPELVVVFVDPLELSYHTFEDIVSLDRFFEEVEITARGPVEALAEGVWRLSLSPSARLSRLDALGLYAPPMNAGVRGGRRMIFHAAPLAAQLTAALRAVLPEGMRTNLVSVNPVFRCNRFDPDDAPFETHHDSPYADIARRQVSIYTVLLYLTGGRGEPALDIDGLRLDEIPEMTCILFDQRLPHRGQGYVEGRKVFLRSELIYEVAPRRIARHRPSLGARFARACYLTRETVVFPELVEESSRCFSLAAAARWSHSPAPAEPAAVPFVHKRFSGLHFVADGHDYWFPARAAALEDCAAVALLDHFNATLGGQSFQSRCASEVVHGSPDGRWVPSFLASAAGGDAGPGLHRLPKDALFPPAEKLHGGMCCPTHYQGFDPTRSERVREDYQQARQQTRAALDPAPVWMLGAEIVLDPRRFRVQGQQIHVLAEGTLPPIHFAGFVTCWDYRDPRGYIDVDVTAEAWQLLVPPILFAEVDGCFHLKLDLFRSQWMVTQDSVAVPIPRIRLNGTNSAGPWFKASAHLRKPRGRRGS